MIKALSFHQKVTAKLQVFDLQLESSKIRRFDQAEELNQSCKNCMHGTVQLVKLKLVLRTFAFNCPFN